MVLVVARAQCIVASAGVGVAVGCARDRTSEEMVSPDRTEESELVANAAVAAASVAYAYVLDVVAAVVTTATATVNAALAAIASPATANTAPFDDAIFASHPSNPTV